MRRIEHLVGIAVGLRVVADAARAGPAGIQPAQREVDRLSRGATDRTRCGGSEQGGSGAQQRGPYEVTSRDRRVHAEQLGFALRQIRDSAGSGKGSPGISVHRAWSPEWPAALYVATPGRS